MNGTAGLVMNGHANPPEIQSVIAEFLLDSPALLDFIVKKVEATTNLTNRTRDSKLRKLSTEIAEVEKQHLEARKAAALEQLEREFAGEAEDPATGNTWGRSCNGLCASVTRDPVRWWPLPADPPFDGRVPVQR
jgi:hypothetical protein